MISIGNITTGGTGKSPLTMEIARFLKQKEKSVGIISRGYGKKQAKDKCNVVRTANKIQINKVELCGDEAYMIAQQLDNTVIITSSNRYYAASKAINEFNCNTILMDDGYQHIKLHRNFNILLIDSHNVFGNGYILPAGPLREDVNEIKRSDAIILVDKGNTNNLSKVENLLKKSQKPIYQAQYVLDKYINIKDNKDYDTIQEQKILAFCGIAQPESFFLQLEKQNKTICVSKAFEDHHNYTLNDLETLHEKAIQNNCQAIITTEKDAVKIISQLDKISLPIYSIRMKMQLDLDKLLKNVL